MNNEYVINDKKNDDEIIDEINDFFLKNKEKKELSIQRTIASLFLGAAFFISYYSFSYIKTINKDYEITQQANIEKIYTMYDVKSKQNYVFTEDTIKSLMVNRINQINQIDLDKKSKFLKNRVTLYFNLTKGSDFTLGFSKYLNQFDSNELMNSINIYVDKSNKNKYKTKIINPSEGYLLDGVKNEVLLDTKNMTINEINDIDLDEIVNVKIIFDGGNINDR